MIRIVVVNLHSNWMWLKNSAVILFGDSPAAKHNYILRYILAHPKEYQLCNYINSRGFSLYRHGSESFQKFLNIFSRIEHRFIMRKNGIPLKSVKVLTRPEEVKSDDIVICYNAMKDTYVDVDKLSGFKVASMIHFSGSDAEDDMIKKAGICCFFNEADLSKTSEIYKRYYHNDISWIIIPFVPAERFKNQTSFLDRKNKCFSTGTITYKNHQEFLSTYGDSCVQPMRKIVMDDPEFFKGSVDCYSCNYEEDDSNLKKIEPSDQKLSVLYKKVHNRFHAGRQKKYFSFNMVEKFNDYKMHFIGEEILGVPGIGFVEGMACGSAFIGIDSVMYRDYGLIPGVHYIAYDGTKDGLQSIVEYWQQPEHQEELEKIANNGYLFVKNNFDGSTVAESLISQLVSYKEKFLTK